MPDLVVLVKPVLGFPKVGTIVPTLEIGGKFSTN